MCKDIIWDFDGTLFDTYPAMVYSFKRALKDDGISDTDDKILKLMKVSLGHAIEYYSNFYTISSDFIERFSCYEKNVNIELIRPFLGASDILEYVIENGGKNFIFTHRDEAAIKYLEYYNMGALFTEVVTKNYGFKRKPDPEGVNHIINKYKICRDNVLGVGDRELDILAAKNSGIKTCFFNSGGMDKDVYLKFGCDYNISNLNELHEIMNT